VSHKDDRFIPSHLHDHIPNMEMIKKQRIRSSQEAIHAEFLDQHVPERSYEHEYGEGLHHHEMVKNYADQNGGKIDVGKMHKMHPNLKDKWKQIFAGKGKLTSDEVQEKMNALPKDKYAISYGKWQGNNSQNTNQQDQMIFRLDHSKDSLKKIKEDRSLYNTFTDIQNVSRQSGHPAKSNTIAWSRIDTTDPKHWLIDEVQSDFGKSVAKQLKNSDQSERAEHVQTISDIHKDWRESTLSAIIKEAKKHGVERISTHSPESKSEQTYSSKVHTVYNDSYKKAPRKMGFLPTSSDNLPLNEHGKKVFDKSSKQKEDLEDNIREAHKHHIENARLYGLMAQDKNTNTQQAENIQKKHLEFGNAYKNIITEHDPTYKFPNLKQPDYSGDEVTAADNHIKNDTFDHHDFDKDMNKKVIEGTHDGHTLDLTSNNMKKSMYFADLLIKMEFSQNNLQKSENCGILECSIQAIETKLSRYSPGKS